MRHRHLLLRTLPALLAAGTLLACADSIVRQLEPINEPALTSAVDSFRFEAFDLESVNDRFTWDWENTQPKAFVIHRTFIHHGYGILIVRDGIGAVVDSVVLQYELDTETEVGAPGTWSVELVLSQARGRVDFQLLARPADAELPEE